MEHGTLDTGQLVSPCIKEADVSRFAAPDLRDWKLSGLHTDMKSPTCIDTLPAEIVRNILSCLRKNTDTIYDEHYKIGESFFRRRHAWDAEDYRNAALANTVLSPWAQQLLVESPVLVETWHQQTSPSALFTRTLLERPDLGTRVRQLTVFIPCRSRLMWACSGALQQGDSTNEIVSRAAAYINTLRIPKKLRISWKKKLRTHYPFSLIGVILTLVSNVTHVTLALDTEVVQDQRIDFLCACFGIRPTKAHNLAYIQRIGTLSFVKSLTIRGPAPVAVTGLDLFPGIQDLHLRLELRPSRHVGLTPAIDSFRNVSRLRLDVQLVPKTIRMILADPAPYFGSLLAAFENLKHLDLSDGPRDNNRDYGYASLELILQHLNVPSQLLSLRLPRTVTSSDMLTATISTFVNLDRLTTPFRAIVNEGLDTFESLPGSLQHLIIHDSILNTVPCVLELLQNKAAGESWAAMQKIELWFAESFTNKSLERLRTGIPDLVMEAAAVGVHLTIEKFVPDSDE